MNEQEREQYLSRIRKESSTIGIDIPDNIDIDGENIPIGDIVFKYSSENNIQGFDFDISELKVGLRRERNSIIEIIETEEISEKKAEDYVSKVKKIDRILNALESDDQDYGQKSKIKEAKRDIKWKNFLDKIRD